MPDFSFNSLPHNLPKTYSFLSHECAKKHSDFDFLLFSIKFLTICLLLSLSATSSSLMWLLLLLFSNPSYCLSLLLDFQTSCHYLCKAKHSKTSSAWRTNLSCSETFLNVGLFYCAFVKQVQKLRSKNDPCRTLEMEVGPLLSSSSHLEPKLFDNCEQKFEK